MKLRALPTEHDLPPLWDGRRVTWRGWTVPMSTVRWHMAPEACTRCGSTEPSSMNPGTVEPLPGEQVDMAVERRTKRSGVVYLTSRRVAAWAVQRLMAFRCATCHHDTVWDMQGEWWDLDESDYGEAGSVA